MKNILKNKKIFDFSVFNISICSLLIVVGIIVDSYIRVGKTTMITLIVYATMAMVLPLSLSLIGGVLIDTFQLLLRGFIGAWYWSLQIEPIIIILFCFLIKNILDKFINKPKIIMAIFIVFIILITSLVISIFILDISIFNTNNNNLYKKDSDVISILKMTFFIIGLVVLYCIFAHALFLIHKNKNANHIMYYLILISLSFLIDCLYHPFAVGVWYKKVLLIEVNHDLINYLYIKGIMNSMIHLSLGAPLLHSLMNVYEKTGKNISSNRY